MAIWIGNNDDNHHWNQGNLLFRQTQMAHSFAPNYPLVN
jgi:hypothetical protein